MSRPQIVGKVAERILRMIAGGEWPRGGVLPSVRQLTSQFGLSQSTVRAALHRLAREGLLEVRPRQPARLLCGAAERAQQLLKPQPRTSPQRVAILIPEMVRPLEKNPFYFTVVKNIIGEAASRGLEASVVWWPLREQFAVAESLWKTGYEAAVFVGYRPEYVTSLFRMHERRFPLVIFNHEVPGLKLPAIIMDLYAAAQKIADCLFKLGHRNMSLVIDSLSGLMELSPRNNMNLGWQDYLVQQGLLERCTIPLYIPLGFGTGHGEKALRILLKSPERPTAIVFSNSVWARNFLTDPENATLKVPAELSLATFDTTASIPAVPWSPPLTNLDIDYIRTAQCIIETIQKMLDGDLNPPTIRVRLDLHLTESVGPAP
jgi:DNA-binding LacI/PurR family transcriptional regulator